MANHCARCGSKLGLLDRARGQHCKSCSQALEHEADEARRLYAGALASLASGKATESKALETLEKTAPALNLSPKERRAQFGNHIEAFVERVLDDDRLSEDEERRFLDLVNAMGFAEDELETTYPEILNRLVVARINDGRLPALDSSKVIPKKGEVVHGEMNAELLKQKAIRQYQGGYSGVSLRVAKGVRFHTGGIRGKSVVVGHELVVEDSGVMSFTSKRAVFMGAKKTIEFNYSKLVGIEVFEDGLRFG